MRPNEITSGRFLLYPHYDDIVIEVDGNSLQIAPGEADKLIEILTAVSGMQQFRAIPPVVVDKPFAIKLNEEGACFLTRDSEDKGVSFPIYNIEELVDGIQLVVRKVADINAIRGGPGAGAKAWNPGDPPIEGR